MILIDVHEPSILKDKISLLGIPVKVTPLEVGDYIVDQIIIERKDIHDLINSVQSGRLWSQLYKMKSTEMKGFLAIIGDIPTWDWNKQSKISREKYLYYKRMLEVVKVRSYLSYNISSLVFPSNTSFVKFIEYVWNYSGRRPGLAPVPKKKTSLIEIKSDMLSCVPGIGRKLANEIARRYSIRDLVSKGEELSNLEVLGRKLGKRGLNLFKVLNYKEDLNEERKNRGKN